MRYTLIAAALLLAASPIRADDARAIISKAAEVAGGEVWLSPATLRLEGHAEFYAPDQPGVVRRADSYVIWRVLDPNRTAAHGPEGKVRITAKSGSCCLKWAMTAKPPGTTRAWCRRQKPMPIGRRISALA